ncbi:hypothetical protein FS749_007224 [Ceratobasidium sp. UAMH 11750]|nr:hypothetical protein FS749_007224 [Ceratobasidium sp. UAMH 11750]
MTIDDSGPLLIAICGATGTGKSTFINDASGANLPVGHLQSSCTQKVETAPRFKIDGREIQLIDTPGFDDTNVSDTEILERIGQFLKLSHNENQLLSGIIYMHRITDNRVGGVSRRNFRVFRELCGPDALKNVVITTNMWQDPAGEAELAREQELKNSPMFFQPVLAKGARMARYIRSRGADSAHDIIRMIMQNKPLPTYLGEALATGVPLAETNPGKTLNEELQKLIEKQKAEIEMLKREMQEALQKRDYEAKQELEEERKQAQQRLETLLGQIASLKTDLTGERAMREKQMEEFHRSRVADQAEIARLTSDIERTKQELQDNSNTAQVDELSRRIHKLQGELDRKKSKVLYRIADFFDNLF